MDAEKQIKKKLTSLQYYLQLDVQLMLCETVLLLLLSR